MGGRSVMWLFMRIWMICVMVVRKKLEGENMLEKDALNFWD